MIQVSAYPADRRAFLYENYSYNSCFRVHEPDHDLLGQFGLD
jgi:hypothetical protein